MSDLIFTRDGASVTATPALYGEPVLIGDEQLIAEMEDSLNELSADVGMPFNDPDTPVCNLCAAAVVCGADMVSTSADDVTAIPADLDSFLR